MREMSRQAIVAIGNSAGHIRVKIRHRVAVLLGPGNRSKDKNKFPATVAVIIGNRRASKYVPCGGQQIETRYASSRYCSLIQKQQRSAGPYDNQILVSIVIDVGE